ncbi:MAG: outer membrane protein assembly factor BamB [Verrucomicrobiales bacterium]|jgi:outer membrane protein assembly factor BamB
MKKTILLTLTLLPFVLQAENWPAWRGDNSGSGATTETDLPLEWGKDKNVAWRVELPDRGNSTPIIWGDRVFVTQAVTETNWRGLMCFDRKDGKLLWKSGLTFAKKERTHRDNPYCSASPTTDGELVVAAYGSAGVAAYDFEGNEVWKRDFGALDHVWGNSTSPVIHGNLVFHYHGPAKGAALYALDKKSGETIWKWDEPKWETGPRTDGFAGRENDNDVIGSWSTPLIVEDQLVMSFPMEIKAFDPASGKVLWTCEGLNPLVYSSPIAADGVVVAQGGYQGNSVAVTTKGERIWREVKHFGGIGSGVIKDGHLYAQDAGGIAHCVDLKTGKTVWKERLPGAGKSWGSLLLAGDLIYTLSQPGDTVAFKAATSGLEVVAQSDVDERTNASLAAAGGDIFIRTYDALWRISAD